MENLSVNVRITCKHLLYPEKEAKIWTNFYYSTEEKKYQSNMWVMLYSIACALECIQRSRIASIKEC